MNKLSAFLTFVFISTSTYIQAGEELLVKYNIEPYILDSGFSTMFLQQRYSYKLDVAINDDGDPHVDSLYGFYEPGTDYGIDHYFKYNPSSLEIFDEDKYKDLLNQAMRTQNRMALMGNSFDPKSLKLIYENESDVLLSFKYLNYGLPQDIAYLRLLTAHVTIRNGELKSIVLSNDRPFRKDFATIDNFRQTSIYRKLANGRYIKESANLSFTSSRWGKTKKFEANSTFIEFADIDGSNKILQPELLAQMQAAELETIRVNLDRAFPLWGAEVRKLGYDLPLPYGISVSYRDQINQLDFTSFEINGSKAFEVIFDPAGSNGDIHSKSPVIRADMFVLPFLNVFAMVGKAEADAELRIAPTELVNNGFDNLVGAIGDYCGGWGQLLSADQCNNFSPSSLPDYIPINLELDVTLAGLGATTAVGYKNFFASVTASYATSFSETAGTETNTLVVSPMAGYQYPQYRARLLVGAEYQDLASSMEGSLGPNFHYNIGIETEKWAWMVGAHKELGDHFEGVLMYSKGEQREAWTFNLGYRF